MGKHTGINGFKTLFVSENKKKKRLPSKKSVDLNRFIIENLGI